LLRTDEGAEIDVVNGQVSSINYTNGTGSTGSWNSITGYISAKQQMAGLNASINDEDYKQIQNESYTVWNFDHLEVDNYGQMGQRALGTYTRVQYYPTEEELKKYNNFDCVVISNINGTTSTLHAPGNFDFGELYYGKGNLPNFWSGELNTSFQRADLYLKSTNITFSAEVIFVGITKDGFVPLTSFTYGFTIANGVITYSPPH
jgi:hypothetical protein